MPMEERMPCQKLAFVPILFTVALLSASLATFTRPVSASDECITEPKSPASRDEHWYYRTDRATNRQCWYLAKKGTSVQKRVKEDSKASPAKMRALPQEPLRTQRSNGTALADASAPNEAKVNVPVQEPEVRRSEPTELPNGPPSLERETSQSFDPIASAPMPAGNDTEELHPAAKGETSQSAELTESPPEPTGNRTEEVHTRVQASVGADLPSFAIVVSLLLLALSAPLYHTVLWMSRRWNIGRWHRSTRDTSYLRAEIGLHTASTEQFAETLQRLLNEMRTIPDGISEATRPKAERELQHD
jgi:hypothetical protein